MFLIVCVWDNLKNKKSFRKIFHDSIFFISIFTKFPAFFLGETKISDEKRKQVYEAFGYMENFLEGRKWFCSDNLTIADLSILASLSSIIVRQMNPLIQADKLISLSCSTLEPRWMIILISSGGLGSARQMSKDIKKTMTAQKYSGKRSKVFWAINSESFQLQRCGFTNFLKTKQIVNKKHSAN